MKFFVNNFQHLLKKVKKLKNFVDKRFQMWYSIALKVRNGSLRFFDLMIFLREI